jgi:hypothetical protein
MNRFFIPLYVAFIFCSSCNFTQFTLRRMNVDELPTTIPAMQVKLAEPVFSMYQMTDKLKKEYNFKIPEAQVAVKRILTADVFKNSLTTGFSGDASCLENKMDPDNLRDTMWYRPEKYVCMMLDTGWYYMVTYITVAVGENISYTAQPMRDHINIYVMVHIIRNGKILYSRRVRKLETMKKSDERRALKETIAAYITEDRLREAVVKATTGLAQRIR